jgi:hypothetical protein
MPSLRERKQAAIAAVARRFRATLQYGADPRHAYLVIAGKRIAVASAALEAQVSRRSSLRVPRLRFDRVALGLLARLHAAPHDGVPHGVTVVVTITAPIRLAAKTAATLEGKIGTLLGQRSARKQLRATVHGNQIRIHLMRGGNTSTPKLVGFVHNPHSDPSILFHLTGALLRRIGSVAPIRTRFPGDQWLVLASEDEPSWIQTYRHVCTQLLARTDFQRIVLVCADGSVSTLAG